jgi:hypothetical protein
MARWMMTSFELLHLDEPTLEFGHRQALADPRDGITLFGPLDMASGYGLRAGVIGPRISIERFMRWAAQIQGPIGLGSGDRARPAFPGFETAFRVPWQLGRVRTLEIDGDTLAKAIRVPEAHQRVYEAVSIYEAPIRRFARTEDAPVDIWFVVVPDDVYRFCRPQSRVPPAEQSPVRRSMSSSLARRLASAPSLFEELNRDAAPYQHEPHFHNQLKGRLLDLAAPLQIVRESTIAFREVADSRGKLLRDLSTMESAIAWNILTTAYYKTGGRPWRLATIRDGVCYLGLVFKADERDGRRNYACCAAKLFLDSGDGIVFRGALGPWYSPETREYHLDGAAARELMNLALDAYREKRGTLPREVFVHGKARFADDEWRGFEDGAGSDMKVIGVRIRDDRTLRLFRPDENTVLRGLAFVRDGRTAYLWTRGFVPRLQTYAGREVPLPLLVDVCKGEADIRIVLADLLALTKLNYNACSFADGLPVTLRFADAVGEILTAGPPKASPPLSFKHYI